MAENAYLRREDVYSAHAPREGRPEDLYTEYAPRTVRRDDASFNLPALPDMTPVQMMAASAPMQPFALPSNTVQGAGTSPGFSWPNLSGLKVGGPEMYAAGAGLEIFSTIAQTILAGKRVKAVANYNAAVAEANAQAAAQAAGVEAQQFRRRAAILRQDQILLAQSQTYREARQREKHERVLGETRAIIGASGIMMEGSPLTVLEETVRQQEMDVLAGRYQTSLQQRALQEETTQAEYQAALSQFGAGERLRVGKQQAALIRAQTPGGYGLAAFTQALGAGARGVSTYGYLKEREKRPTDTGVALRG